MLALSFFYHLASYSMATHSFEIDPIKEFTFLNATNNIVKVQIMSKSNSSQACIKNNEDEQEIQAGKQCVIKVPTIQNTDHYFFMRFMNGHKEISIELNASLEKKPHLFLKYKEESPDLELLSLTRKQYSLIMKQHAQKQ